MTSPTGLIIIGAGGFGRSVGDGVLAAGIHTVAGFVDDRGSDLGSVLGETVLGRSVDLSKLRKRHGLAVVAIGDIRHRREIC